MYAWTLICKELSKVREEELSKLRNASELKHKEVDPLMNAPPGCANLPLDEKILNSNYRDISDYNLCISI